MSVINKYPFINTLLGSLTSEQLKDLNDCINGQYEGSVVFRTLKSWGDSLLTESDKGIYPIQLELNGPAATTLPGYLVYTNDHCVLISYADDDACKLAIVNITMPTTGSYIKWEYVSESLTVNELRSSLFDAAAGEGGGGGSGGIGFEEVEIKIYYSDLNAEQLQTGNIIITNTEKINAIVEIGNEILINNKLVLGRFETPLYSEDDIIDMATGSVSASTSIEGGVISFGCILSYNNQRMQQFNFLSGGQVITFISNPTDLITLLATDATKYISLKFRVEK